MINKRRGEIATFLTLVSVGLMIIGMMTGSYLTQRETKTVGRAAVSCDKPEWYCKFTQADGSVVEECASQEARDLFSSVWCDPADRWRYEAAVSTARCNGRESRQIPASGSCTATPIPQPTGGGCPPGQWECRYQDGANVHQNCADSVARDQFTAIWCKPEQRWKWEDAGNTARCAGEESYKLTDVGGNCSITPAPKATSTPVPGQTGTPGGPYKCEDLTQYTLRDCRITMNGPCTYGAWKYDCVSNPGANCNWNDSGVGIPYWCDGNKWYLMNNAGECTTACYKGGPNVTQAPNATKAPNPGGFHLTSDIYAKRDGVNIKFEFNIIFNSDGCDGDVTLYKDGAGPIAGPNGWRGPGGFTYYPQWTQSPTLARGNSATVSYEGRVDRCPRSATTLKDSISCTLSVDANGNPSITGTGCNFANKADFPAATPPVIPTSATGCNLPRTTDFKKECTDCIYTGDKGWIDTLKSRADSSNKCSLEEVVEFWCSGGMENGQLDNINLIGKKECTERYIDKNSRSYRSCADLCSTQAGGPTLTPVITYGPGTPSPVPPTPTYGPTLPLRATPVISPTPTIGPPPRGSMAKIHVKLHVEGTCRFKILCDDVYNNFVEFWYQQDGAAYTAEKGILNHEGPVGGSGLTSQDFSNDIEFEAGKNYKGIARFMYIYKGLTCIKDTNSTLNILPTKTNWDIETTMDRDKDCTNLKPTPFNKVVGSSNKDYQAVIDKFKNGQMSSQEVSAFISQISRTPSLQVQYCNAPAGECESPTYPITEGI